MEEDNDTDEGESYLRVTLGILVSCNSVARERPGSEEGGWGVASRCLTEVLRGLETELNKWPKEPRGVACLLAASAPRSDSKMDGNGCVASLAFKDSRSRSFLLSCCFKDFISFSFSFKVIKS